MEKINKIKEQQGFVKNAPCCGNCVNFSSEQKPIDWNPGYTKETNMRCTVGNFKVGKSNWCRLQRFAEK